MGPDVSYGVPQGSILDPLLFNTYINNIISATFKSDVHFYADDATFDATVLSLQLVIKNLFLSPSDLS